MTGCRTPPACLLQRRHGGARGCLCHGCLGSPCQCCLWLRPAGSGCPPHCCAHPWQCSCCHPPHESGRGCCRAQGCCCWQFQLCRGRRCARRSQGGQTLPSPQQCECRSRGHCCHSHLQHGQVEGASPESLAQLQPVCWQGLCHVCSSAFSSRPPCTKAAESSNQHAVATRGARAPLLPAPEVRPLPSWLYP